VTRAELAASLAEPTAAGPELAISFRNARQREWIDRNDVEVTVRLALFWNDAQAKSYLGQFAEAIEASETPAAEMNEISGVWSVFGRKAGKDGLITSMGTTAVGDLVMIVVVRQPEPTKPAIFTDYVAKQYQLITAG
jgi:hypothetical protein